jgi:hypothetical protein
LRWIKLIIRKKIAAILAASMLVGMPSAFASDGFADTPETAVPTGPGGVHLYTISDSTDVDWYSWTNNTGQTLSNFSVELTSPAGYNYDLLFRFDWGFQFYADDNGVGQVDSVGGGPIYPGETIYFMVEGHGVNDHTSYNSYVVRFNGRF